MNARKQYLEEPRKEYERAEETARGRLLDEAEKRMRLNRKYLIRILNHPVATVGNQAFRPQSKHIAAEP